MEMRPNRWVCAAFVGWLLILWIRETGGGEIRERHGMVFVPGHELTVGTSPETRVALAERFDCHPTWLDDDLSGRKVELQAFWIDRHPVTNAQYLAFLQATGREPPYWWRGTFPAGYAGHPVVGVSGEEAEAYAKWAHKRLPLAEEWEAAAGSGSLFAWGDAWPGPIKRREVGHPAWKQPGTSPVGTGLHGKSVRGVEDFAGQALEWTASVTTCHGGQFRLMKGASWLHQDALSYRTAAGRYAPGGWVAAFSGFRCALDRNKVPQPVPNADTEGAADASKGAAQAGTPESRDGPPELGTDGGRSQQVWIRVPRLGRGTFRLGAPEVILWNGQAALKWDEEPNLAWTERTTARASYVMRTDKFLLHARFVAHDDHVEQVFTVRNLTPHRSVCVANSCFSLEQQPMFYDCEQQRTYALAADGRFVPTRRLPRHAKCIHWLAKLDQGALGRPISWALLAVVSRDGKWVLGCGRAGVGRNYSVATNALFSCLHAEAEIVVKPRGTTTTRQRYYFLAGGLPDLLVRFRKDFRLGGD